MSLPLPLLTNSALSPYRRCAREYRYAYVDGHRPATVATPLRFGTRWHAAMDAWWLAVERGHAFADGVRVLRASADPADPYETVTLECLLAGYSLRWMDLSFELLAKEQTWTTELRNPETGEPSRTYRLAGKVDGIVRVDGRTLLLEHKTTSDDIGEGGYYRQRLRVDSQVSLYYLGARSLGFDVEGCLYDVVRKPTIKPLEANTKRATRQSADEWRERLSEHLAENPHRYFQRMPVVRLESEQREAEQDAWQQAKALRESERLDRFPRNSDACFRGKGGYPCPFFTVCSGAGSLSDTNLYRQAKTTHEELTT